MSAPRSAVNLGSYQVRRGRRYWAELAAQARAQAQTAVTPANKEVLLRMSEAYERLAATAAKREGDKKGSDDASQ
jgi:hypothetical protein